jgi:hypothetical protein
LKDCIRFDWLRIQYSPALESIAEQIAHEALASESYGARGASSNKRYDNVKHIAHWIVSSLHFVTTTPSRRAWLSIPLNARSYHKKDPTKINLSHSYVKLVYDTLAAKQWITIKTGQPTKHLTLIKPRGLLRTNLLKIGMVWMPQEPISKDSCLELKDVTYDAEGKAIRRRTKNKFKTKKKNLPIPQPDTPEIAQQRDNLHKINSFLTQHCITIDLNDEQLQRVLKQKDKDGNEESYILDPRAVQLTRIFSRGGMQLGGRFYRGWWQAIPEQHRPHIRIDGYKTIEVDYSAMHVHILYGMLNSRYESSGCPYDIIGEAKTDQEWQQDPRRKLVKKIFNAFINDVDGVFSVNKTQQKQLGMTQQELRERFISKHPLIAEHFSTDIGLRGQYVDSNIAEQVMLRLIDEGIVALPIHDSFIVRAGYQSYLEATMRDVFYEIAGSTANLSSGVVKNNDHFGLTEQEVLQQQRANSAELELRIKTSSPNELVGGQDHLDIVTGKDTFDLIFTEEESIMDRYLLSYLKAQQGS